MTTSPQRIIRMTLEYDGTSYAGWQRQASDRTIQQTVEEALEAHLRHPVRVTASGRTDAGVHALGQVISFPTTATMPAAAVGRGLATHLPNDIAVIDAADAPPDFDARRSARLRSYRFFLSNRNPAPAIGANYLTHVRGRLDLDLMREAAGVLAGEHDFSAFRSSACTATRTRLTLHPIEITTHPRDIIQIDYRCRSFLHNMVRILTGTLVAAGQGKLTVSDITTMLQTGIRPHQAKTVKPNGLFLYHVNYEETP